MKIKSHLTGGRAAEEVVFNQITTGASNDIEQATKLARAMITRYGMSDEFDMVALETVTNQYLGGDASLACSADTQKEIDRQVTELVKNSIKRQRSFFLIIATNWMNYRIIYMRKKRLQEKNLWKS